MSWSKATSMLPRGRAASAPGGGFVAITRGASTGLNTSIWCDWLSSTRPSPGAGVTSPRRPPGAHAHVAVGAPGVPGRVEALDAVAGGDVEQAGGGLDGQALRQPVAELAEDRAGGGVELEQGAAAGRRPHVAGRVQGHAQDRDGQ